MHLQRGQTRRSRTTALGFCFLDRHLGFGRWKSQMPVEMMEEIQSTLPIGGQKVDEHFPAEFRIFTSGNVHGGGSSLDEGLGIFFPLSLAALDHVN